MKRNEGIHRYDISDEARKRIKELLHGQAQKSEEAPVVGASPSCCRRQDAV